MVIHMLGHTEIAQLFSMPRLLTHYFQHRQINPGLGFIAFLEMHYGGDDGTKADNDLDQKLPFHQTDHTSLGFVFAMINTSLPEMEFFPGKTIEMNTAIIPGNPSEHVLLFIQPPRIV